VAFIINAQVRAMRQGNRRITKIVVKKPFITLMGKSVIKGG
jgi:hypothetical protein